MDCIWQVIKVQSVRNQPKERKKLFSRGGIQFWSNARIRDRWKLARDFVSAMGTAQTLSVYPQTMAFVAVLPSHCTAGSGKNEVIEGGGCELNTASFWLRKCTINLDNHLSTGSCILISCAIHNVISSCTGCFIFLISRSLKNTTAIPSKTRGLESVITFYIYRKLGNPAFSDNSKTLAPTENWLRYCYHLCMYTYSTESSKTKNKTGQNNGPLQRTCSSNLT